MFQNKNENNNSFFHSNFVNKKEKAILKVYEEPILPKLCLITYWCMIILTISMLLVEINTFIRYDSYLGYAHLFYNISTTGFISWLLFSVLLILLSYLAIKQTASQYRKRFHDTLKNETPDEIAKAQSERALKRLTRPFTRYTKICIIGIIFWSIFFLFFHI